MKIIKYKKISNGKYEILLEDNTKLKIYEEIILKENLLWKKEIGDVDALLRQNDEYAIWDVAYKYLDHHVVSKLGMFRYLERKGFSSNQVEEVIKHLVEKKLLNDEYYAKCYINNQVHLTNDGPIKIRHHLEEDGIPKEIYMSYLDIDENIWQEKIEKYLEKQVRLNKKSHYLFRNKMIVNLMNLGYEKELIESSLNKITLSNQQELKDKEEEKIRIRLSRKYSGDELEKKVREKLYQKGFFD